MSDDVTPSGNDPLDELLASAAWPEATPQQMARLASTWDQARPRPTSMKLWANVSAAAAAIVGVVVWQGVSRRPDPANVIPVAIDDAVPTPPTHVEPPTAAPDESFGRPATPWELSLLRVAEDRAAREQRRVQTDPLERAVARLIEDPLTDLETAAEVSRVIENVTARVAEELSRARGPRRIALARLLIAVDPPDGFPILIALWSDPLTRALVEPAVVRAADAQTLASLLNSRMSFDERVRLLSEIATRPDQEALVLLAMAARDPVFRPAAFAAVPHASLDASFLLNLLVDDSVDVRVGAALLLGVHGDPQLTDALIVLVRENPSHSELWLALMQRSDPQARAFVAAARQDPQVMASVHLAEAARQTLIAPVLVGVPL